ncbi:hypothetical protein HPB51_010840 [Rhipicephalus microplus]|uniref:EB domain-containing protein n=1 Tax=Rhipicephalus microplus TaxID=6941 RepID=A0A9J6DMH0_RHIMP|nr:hypothetical protein HPB51_010840 [Rhipicephalus microplus]
MPVLLRLDGSFSCAQPRRLDERCLSHAECSHANEHARCLRSVCRCPPTYYATKASLLVPARRRGMAPRYGRPLRFSPTAPKDSRELRYERFLKCLEGGSTCKRLSTISTTFRFETDYLRIQARHDVLGRTPEIPEMSQRQRLSPIRRKSSEELEGTKSEGCSSNASLTQSDVVAGTGRLTSKTPSTMTETNSSMSVPHRVRRKSGSTGGHSGKLRFWCPTPARSHLAARDQTRSVILRTISKEQSLGHTLSIVTGAFAVIGRHRRG